jgi:hypothetical protein
MTETVNRVQLADLYEHGVLLTTRLSPRSKDRYDAALWYAWGRDDAGDHRLHELPQHGAEIGNDFAFAAFAALEAEAFDRQLTYWLRPVLDQFERYVAELEAQR